MMQLTPIITERVKGRNGEGTPLLTSLFSMGRVLLAAALVFVLSGGGAVQGGVEKGSPGEKDWPAQLERGEIPVSVMPMPGRNTGWVQAAVLINAAPETVWQTMIDCDIAVTYVPGMEGCQVLESGRGWDIIRHDVKWVWFMPRVSYVFRADYKTHRQIDFVRLKGDLRDMRGAWRLEGIDEGRRTIVTYAVYLDPGFLVPQWLVRRSLKKDLPAVLIALRAQVEKSLR